MNCVIERNVPLGRIVVDIKTLIDMGQDYQGPTQGKHSRDFLQQRKHDCGGLYGGLNGWYSYHRRRLGQSMSLRNRRVIGPPSYLAKDTHATDPD